MKPVRKLSLLLAAGLMVALAFAAIPTARAQTATCDQTYVVVSGDWLSKIAEKLLGSSSAYNQIVEATNNAAKTDNTFATITDPNTIQVGQKLCIPKGAGTTAPPAATTTTPATTATALTQAQLANATYTVEGAPGGKVTLKDGKAEVEQAPGSATKFTAQLGTQFADGDLNGDGAPDTAAVLITSGGGSGTFYNLAVVPNEKGQPGAGVTTLVGDRIKVSSLAISSGVVTVNYLDRKPDEPLAAEPTVQATKNFKLEGGKLVASAAPAATTPAPPTTVAAGSPEGIYIASSPAADAAALLYRLDLAPGAIATLTINYVGRETAIQEGIWSQTTPTTLNVDLLRQENRNIGVHFTFEMQGDKLVATKYDPGLYGDNGLTLSKATGTLSGTVTYNEKIALTDNAVVEVYLVDVSDSSQPARILNGVSYTTHGKQVPLAFEIPYAPSQITANGKYVLQAFISADGRLLFKNDSGVGVLAAGSPTSNIQITAQAVP